MKRKLLDDKKGINDISILSGIISIFIFLGVLLPFINSAFETDVTNFATDDVANNIGQQVGDVEGSATTVTGLKILVSVLKMFFWTFGDLPFWLDGIFVIFRIILVLILIKYIPFIGA